MSTKTEVENLKTSGAERVLAVVLAVFILIGAFWAYDSIGGFGSGDSGYDFYSGNDYQARTEGRSRLTSEDRDALTAQSEARRDVRESRRDLKRAGDRSEVARENWRAELEAGLPASIQEAAYRASQVKVETARRALREDRQALAATRPAAETADRKITDQLADIRSEQDRDQVIIFLLRLALVGGMLGGGYVAMSRIRRRRSGLLPLALADIGAAAALGLYMAGDYGEEWGAFDDVGPLVISIVGIALTVLAFVLLQRYLAKQIPLRRVRKHECPFCGYPVRDNQNCEGCGRRVLGECSTCHEPRRVGTPHCGSCGNS